MNDQHQPRPEFVSYLDWQIQTAMRRQDRFAVPAKANGRRGLKLASLILVSVLFGAGGVLATEEVQDAKAQEILVARVEGEIRMAGLQLEMVRTNLEETRRHVDAGVMGQEALMDVELRVREAEAHFSLLTLDLEEIQATGREPRTDIAAPLVGDRDLVTERLRLEEWMAVGHLQNMEERFGRLEELVDLGTVGTDEVQDVALALEEARAQVQLLHDRMGLREDFLKGDISAERAERELEVADARRGLDLQIRAYNLAQDRLVRLEELVGLGVVPQAQVDQALLRLMRQELEVDLIRRTLDALLGSVGGEGGA